MKKKYPTTSCCFCSPSSRASISLLWTSPFILTERFRVLRYDIIRRIANNSEYLNMMWTEEQGEECLLACYCVSGWRMRRIQVRGFGTYRGARFSAWQVMSSRSGLLVNLKEDCSLVTKTNYKWLLCLRILKDDKISFVFFFEANRVNWCSLQSIKTFLIEHIV